MSPNHRIQAEQLSKTRRCSFFLEGRCKYTEGCTYAHSLDELRKAPEELRKTKMCDLFLQGLCRDDKCNFAHDYQEIRCRRRSRPVNDAVRRHSVTSLASSAASNANDETVILLRQIAALLQAKTAPKQDNIPPGFEAPSLLGYQTAGLIHRENPTDALSDTLNRLAFMALSCTEEESTNEQVVTPLPTNPGFSLY